MFSLESFQWKNIRNGAVVQYQPRLLKTLLAVKGPSEEYTAKSVIERALVF